MRLRKRKEDEIGVDMSPLIDMVFILLIFFMVSTTFVKDMQVDISRPAASSAKPSSSKSLRIFIDSGNSVYLNGEKIRTWVLQGKIRDKVKSDRLKSVLIVTDKNVKADKLVEVVDQCRMAGISDIGVATEQELGS